MPIFQQNLVKEQVHDLDEPHVDLPLISKSYEFDSNELFSEFYSTQTIVVHEEESIKKYLEDPYYEQSDEEPMGEKSTRLNDIEHGSRSKAIRDDAETFNMDDYINVGDDVYMESSSEDDDELRSSCESDFEEKNSANVRRRSIEFNPQTDMRNPIFKIGMIFPSKDDFKKAVKEYGIKNHRAIRLVKNDKLRVRAVCIEDCPWTLFASVLEDGKTFIVKTMNEEHTCGLNFSNKYISAKWLAEKYESKWRSDPNWSLSSFIGQVRDDTQCDVSRWQFYKARKRARRKIQGSIKEQYARLWDYCDELRRTNPGSTIIMKCNAEGPGNPKFERLYICLAACKKGFLTACRPLIGLDGCHVKYQQRGQILGAIGIDPNNSIFPIAYALVESECKSSWQWFLDLLLEDLNINDPNYITWISDKQKGLVETIKEKYNEDNHRYCVRHLYNNFKLQYKGLALKQHMWNAARATTVAQFEAHMDKLKQDDLAAYNWLAQKDPKHWSRAYFSKKPACDILLNNLCESFNSAILEARDKPIITLLEKVKIYIRKRFEAKRTELKRWKHNVGPRIYKILEKNQILSRNLIVDYCGNMRFEVRCPYGSQYEVDLNDSKCGCKRWDLSGLPCAHTIACIDSRGLKIVDFVNDYYKKTLYEQAYSGVISPMNGPAEWKKSSHTPVQEPEERNQPGRPKTKRCREPGEIQGEGSKTIKLTRSYIVLKCRNCGVAGHNQRTCPKSCRK